MSEIVILSGSPSAPSRMDLVLQQVQMLVEKQGFTVTNVSVRDFAPEILANARWDHEDIKKLTETIEKAEGVIIGSPVYKASYTGVLKCLLDLLPENIFKDKPVFPLMVGGSQAHLLAIDYSLKPIIAILKGQPIQGLYLTDKQIDKDNQENPIQDEALVQRMHDQVEQFSEALNKCRVYKK